MMTTAAQWLVMLSGIWLIAVSMLMVASPQTALRHLSKMASRNFINYLEITLRMIWGLALVEYAKFSRFPEVLRSFGLLLVITSAVLFLIPRKWHARYAVWWSNKLPPPFVRIASSFSFALGVFLIWAVV